MSGSGSVLFGRHVPHPVAYLVAAMVPVLLLGLVVVPIGALRLYSAAQPGSGTTSGAVTEGEAGLGDRYYPRAGNSGYEVDRYGIEVSWDPQEEALAGRTSVTARASQTLGSFYLDLALDTQAVQVDGVTAEFEREGFSDLRIVPATPVPAGSEFEVTVSYAGRPGELRQGEVRPWWTTGQEWSAIGEPESAAWWFPSNDHPSDPALMEVSVRVPAGMEALSVGRLESRDTAAEADFDTWRWVARQPMPTFANFLSIGQYEVRETTEDGLPALYAVTEQLSRELRREAFDRLLTSGERVRELAALFGPYPLTELGGVVPAHDLWFGALENQTRPIYDAESILDDELADRLITHELAHMWFGNQVTVRQWDDIFNSEAYASWAEWALEERRGGQPAQEALTAAYDRLAGRPPFWRISMIDPGRDHLFDAVYTRGPMTLQALRTVLGEEPFLQLTREWAAEPGSRSVEDFMVRAQAKTTTDLGPFFDAWIRGERAPARTAANGLT